MAKLVLVSLLLAGAGAVELTPENWEEHTAGKTVLIKFLAPWWGHCKSMKPDYDKLMKNWNKGDRAKSSLIADVDCTAAGKPLCEEHGVRGFPTLKWGDPSSLEDYKGGRDYEALKKFAKENLKPQCSPSNIDLCDEDKKKEIVELQALPAEELAKKIAAQKQTIKDAEENFEAEVKQLQENYEKLQKDKEAAIAEVKASGLGLMQAVESHAKKANEAKDEL